MHSFDERLRPLFDAVRGTRWEMAAELLVPLDGSPVTLDAVTRRAARRYTLAPQALRSVLAHQALTLAEKGPPNGEEKPPRRPEPISAVLERVAGQMNLFGST